MKTSILPVFSNLSSMHRVFGDPQPSTEIHMQDNVLGSALLSGISPDGDLVEIRTRKWYWSPSYAKGGIVTTRFEAFINGVLVDYTCERNLIVKTFRWLTSKGQIHKS